MEWLRRHLRAEAVFQLFQGGLFAIVGLLFLAVISWGIILIVAIASGPSMLSSVRGIGFFLGGVLLLLLLLAFRGACRTRWGLVYCEEERGIGEILRAGLGLFITSFECGEKSLRLWRLSRHDLPRVATIILWLFDKGRKATVEEISAGLPGGEAVRILPQLRDIPGVVWLTYHHGVILLTAEMRAHLVAALHQNPPTPATEPEPATDEEPPPSPAYLGSDEAVAWYVALGLPPFAPLGAVKKRYRQLVKIHHPDAMASRSNGNRKNASDEQIKRINAAYHNIIKNSRSGE